VDNLLSQESSDSLERKGRQRTLRRFLRSQHHWISRAIHRTLSTLFRKTDSQSIQAEAFFRAKSCRFIVDQQHLLCERNKVGPRQCLLPESIEKIDYICTSYGDLHTPQYCLDATEWSIMESVSDIFFKNWADWLHLVAIEISIPVIHFFLFLTCSSSRK
jgi:hypothetical protein